MYVIIIDRGFSAPGHGRDVVDVLNATYKRFIFHLTATFQLPGSKLFYAQMTVHTATQNTDVSLAQEFQKHLSNKSLKHVLIYPRKHKKDKVNKSGKTESIMCNILKI